MRNPVRSSRRESAVFAACGVAIALNVIIDSLLVQRPGAHLADHILEAAFPLAFLALAGGIYARLLPGLRAVIALSFGTLALVWAGLALAEAIQTGLRANHSTGLLLIPAGAALLGVGGVTLWRTRRPGRLRYLRRALWGVVGLLLAYWIMLPIGMAAYATHRPQTPVPAFATAVDYEEVTVRTADGLELHAWYIPSRNGAAIVTYPREWTTAHAIMLADKGYGVLLLDMRGYGESEGDPNAFGWGCTKDIDAGVAFLRSRADVRDGAIGGLGLSVGGEQMIEAAANTGLRAVVSDGAGERSVRESLIRGPRGYFAIPMMALQTAAVSVLAGDTPPPSLERLTGKISPRPIFLIYAERAGGGEELNPDYYAAAGEPKTIWKVTGAAHTAGIADQPDEYARRVGDFFEQALLD